MSQFADRASNIGVLKAARLIGLVRTTSAEEAILLGRALMAGGLRAVEVSFITPGAEHAIEVLAGEETGMVGAGTVMQPHQAMAALAAGARFLVAPHQPKHLVPYARDAGAVAILGGLTPTEIVSAHEAGADFVKIFPARAVGGPRYLRDIRAPLPDIPLLVSGGVEPTDYQEYLAAGASLVLMGSAFFPQDMIKERRWEAISQHVHDFLQTASRWP